MQRLHRGPGALLLLAAMVVLAIRPAGATAVAFCFGLPADIVSAGTIAGTSGDDVIVGSDGADTIDGKGGNDVICAGAGDDNVKGGSGHDLIFGEQGSDVLDGGSGDDNIFGDADDDSVFEFEFSTGWDGYDPDFGACGTSQPGYGADTLTGGLGNDALLDLCGNNWADGGSGADILDISGTALGNSGSDPIVWAYDGLYDGEAHAGAADGGSGNDSYVYVHGGIAKGGSGNDAVFAEHTGSVAEGGSGNDYVGDYSDSYVDIDEPFFHDDAGAVTLNGGSGSDTCNTATPPDDTLISCETVI